MAIVVGIEPGSAWRYSGGGYLLLELLVEEISGESFEAFMSRAILQPLDMTRSGYSGLGKAVNSAKPYDTNGKPSPSYRYASKAATGFNSSAGDLAKLVKAHFPAVANKPLSQPMIDAMRKPHAKMQGIFDVWGLGTMLYAPTSSGDYVFGHDGSNDPAINVCVRINPDTGDGIVMLETGNKSLATRLGSEWVFWQTGIPDFLDIPKEIRRVIPAFWCGVFIILLTSLTIALRCHRIKKRKNMP